MTPFEYIAGPSTRTGRFCRIYAVSQNTVVALAAVRCNSGEDLINVPLPAGSHIDGDFNSVTLASGAVVVYRIEEG